jgi:Holliday junction resolvase-like predicted endonuclease
MQAWINNLLKEYYDLDFQPINGAISGRKEAGSSLTTSILKKFDSYPGFAALVLSPEVAGVGLNITCANHIIHYGRWWNPAKEDQATCRAYRKGQMKDVYLYVPIGEGPEGQQSFDEKLDAMLRSKSLMRKDFLTPMGNLDLSDKDASILIPGYQNTDSIDAKAEGHEFEAIVADWLRGHGYQNVQVTKASHDWGADVLAVKDNCFYIVQCKRQLQSSEDVVNALNQAKTYYGNQADYSSYYLGRKMVIVVASKYEINESTRKFYESRNILVLKEDWS